jgi:hypothetical protein
MGLRKRKALERRPHPDGRIELALQRIIGCQRAIARYELLVKEYRDQMTSISDEQDQAGSQLRGSAAGSRLKDFEADMAAQARRMEAARAGITGAEEAITAQYDEIAKLADGLSDTDLAYL